MRPTLESCRLYFWPLIAANAAAATYGAGGDPRTSLGLSLVLCLLASFGFIVNDLSDRRIDRANRAGHFEDSNWPTLTIGGLTAAALLGAAMLLARAAGPAEQMLAGTIAAILLAYSHLLRRMLLVPNLVTAIVASSPLWAPLILIESRGRAWQWWQVGAVVMLVTAREVFMDIRDRHGDLAGGRLTLPILFGARRSASAAARLTAAALIPLTIAVVIGLRSVSYPAQACSAVLTAVMAYTLLSDTRRIVAVGGEQGEVIQRYVYRSRLVMALVPAFALFLT